MNSSQQSTPNNAHHSPIYPSHSPNHGHGEYHHAAAAAATANAALSQQHASTPTTVNGKKRKAVGVPGSRGVANLTPEQLAKKRANDREAQRAIRERTKNTIETLERRIKELESQQPYQEMQRLIQERDQALADCADLRKRLGAVRGIVSPEQPPGLNELAALTAQQSPLPPVAQQGQQRTPNEQQHLHPDLRSPHQTHESTLLDTIDSPLHQSAEGLSRKQWSPHLEQHPSTQGLHAQDGIHYDSDRSSHTTLQQHQASGERLGLNFLLDSNHSGSTPARLGLATYQPPESSMQPLFARLPKIGPESCLLDKLLTNFRNSRRKMIEDGASLLDAIGPDNPSYGAFANPLAPVQRPSHDVSTVLIELLSKFPDINRLPEKVAVLYVMFLVLRWLICPCSSCYERLPEWCRPIKEQLEKPHDTWLDYLPWPDMRRQVILNEEEVKFDDFFVPYTTTLSLNWPYSEETVLSMTPATSPSDPPAITMNPTFEHHCRTLANWSLGSQFRNMFPQLVDETVRIKD